MKTAIVTGASGFIGAHLISELLANSVKITAVCRKDSFNNSRIPQEADIVYSFDDLPKADVFYHLAWESASGHGRQDPFTQTDNARLTLNACEVAHKLEAKFIALGTVYERFADRVKESQKFSSSDFYVLAKDFTHSISSQHAYKLGLDYIWCQICHPIGHYIKSDQLMAYTISNLIEGTSPSFGKAQTLFDIVAVEDVVKGLYLLGHHNASRREYYIGSGSPMALCDYLEKAKDILNSNTPLMMGQRPDDGLTFEKSWFSIKPIYDDVGYAPTVSFEKAVHNVAKWVVEQK